MKIFRKFELIGSQFLMLWLSSLVVVAFCGRGCDFFILIITVFLLIDAVNLGTNDACIVSAGGK